MIAMGVSGSFDRADEHAYTKSPVHDSSVTLIRDGAIVAAVEEERFNRRKHSGKLPLDAMRFCLDTAGIRLQDVDRIVFNVDETGVNQALDAAYRAQRIDGVRLARPFIQHLLHREFRCSVDPARFEFIDHHYAHAASAFYPSGFDESLVVTLDGMGSGLSGSVWLGQGQELVHLRSYDGAADPTTQSLGHFYLAVTSFLGFGHFDEYKVMGLAPYGDRERLRAIFSELYTLKEEGGYGIHLSRLDRLREICPPRARSEPIAAVHQDIAASLQETLEIIAFHVLRFYAGSTGARRLCVAGGVAQNCALNGRVLREGLFDEAFVQPASHDGGLSLGGALHGYCRPGAPCVMRDAYLGPSCGDEAAIAEEVQRWAPYLEIERMDDPAAYVAGEMAGGAVVGWVQGRSEFGPRALGNRSIVADPRPASHKDLINAMIKKREAFRPFAPSVLEEEAETYFELPPHQKQFPYMVFVVTVREAWRELLGAVTHVDGTARIQTVSRETNPSYWHLIDEFRRRTGVPILLNTSFNNHAEPIVESARDAIVCYLTTGLHLLVVGNFVMRKKPVEKSAFGALRLSVPSDVRIHRRPAAAAPAPAAAPVAAAVRARAAAGAASGGAASVGSASGSAASGSGGAASAVAEAEPPFFKQLFQRLSAAEPSTGTYLTTTAGGRNVDISPGMASILAEADGYRTLQALIERAPDADDRARLLDEALDLWNRRLVRLLPAS